MPIGRIRRVPFEVDNFLNTIKNTEQLPNYKMAFIKLKDYAILGKETDRLSKAFGVKILK
jgi:hypothetical protein